MMDEDGKPMDIGKRSSIESKVIDIPLLSRDDATWMQFMGADNVAEMALRGQWLNSDTRGLLWRLLLGVIPRDMPPSLWREHMSCKRQEYQDLRAEHRVDIAKVVDTTDPMSANPLFSGSSSGDDPWSHFYERKEMIDTIKADLERLYPTGCGEHFLAPARQELLLSVLSLWADLHPDTGYRQGMHEVLAPFVLALEKEVAAATRAAGRSKSSATLSQLFETKKVNGNVMEATAHVGASAALNEASPSEDLEADAFWLFSAVMTGLEGFYEHGGMRSVQQRSGGGGQVGTRDGLDSPVVEMCKRIQGSRMREADPELQRHLAHLDISPQLYGMKWARLLFGREFRVERVLQLWDHIFASSWLEGRPDLPECVEGVAVAMVLSVRNELLAEDSTGCLQLLMRYPPDQSVFTIINLSLALGQPGGYRHADITSSGPRLATSHDSEDVLCPSSGPSESVPAWLMDGGKAGVDSGNGLAKHASRNTLNNAGERLQRPGAGGVVGGRGSGGASFGKEGGIERRGSERNNWQQGLDEFTRRAFSAAQDVAKMAVQTVERSQHGGAPIAEAPTSQALARRLRTVCAAMEGGKVSMQAAAEDIREVARLLERGHSRRPQSANHVNSSGSVGSTGGGGSGSRAFSTYSEDDGCADSLYTRDL